MRATRRVVPNWKMCSHWPQLRTPCPADLPTAPAAYGRQTPGMLSASWTRSQGTSSELRRGPALLALWHVLARLPLCLRAIEPPRARALQGLARGRRLRLGASVCAAAWRQAGRRWRHPVHSHAGRRPQVRSTQGGQEWGPAGLARGAAAWTHAAPLPAIPQCAAGAGRAQLEGGGPSCAALRAAQRLPRLLRAQLSRPELHMQCT